MVADQTQLKPVCLLGKFGPDQFGVGQGRTHDGQLPAISDAVQQRDQLLRIAGLAEQGAGNRHLARAKIDQRGGMYLAQRPLRTKPCGHGVIQIHNQQCGGLRPTFSKGIGQEIHGVLNKACHPTAPFWLAVLDRRH